MKKILVLLMVLGMSSWAYAGMIDVVIDGYDDNDQSGDISPSDLIYIKITVGDGYGGSGGYDLDLHVSGPGTLQEVDGGPTANHQMGMGMWVYSGIANNSIDRMVEVSMGSMPGDLIWGLAIHCDGEGDVLVDLTLNGTTRVDGVVLTEADLGDLVIKQVPEPMTIALLGLGGLLALRRRK